MKKQNLYLGKMSQNLLYFLRKRVPFRGILDQIAEQSAAAFSLQNLSFDTRNNPVVRIRRSSDDLERDFTVREIDNGFLLFWVNEDVVIFQDDYTSNVIGGGNLNITYNTSDFLAGSRSVQFTGNGATSVAFSNTFYRGNYLQGGLTYKFRVGVKRLSGDSSSRLSVREYATSNAILFDDLPVDEWTYIEGEIIATDRGSRFAIGGETGVDFRVDDFEITQLTANGHVRTWYDSSENARHATQTAALSQPLLVENGELVVENGKPTIKFDGVDDCLELGSPFGSLPNLTPLTVISKVRRGNVDVAGRIFSIGHGSGTAQTRGFSFGHRQATSPANAMQVFFADTESQASLIPSSMALQQGEAAIYGISREWALKNDTVSTATISNTFPWNNAFSTDMPSRIGAAQGFTTPQVFFTGSISSVIFWPYQLTTEQALKVSKILS